MLVGVLQGNRPSRRRLTREEVMLSYKGRQAGDFSLLLGEGHLFILARPSVDWMSPPPQPHIRVCNLLYSISWF